MGRARRDPSQGSDEGRFSRDGLGRMREALRRHVEHGNVPGLVAAVSRRGETHVKALGARTTSGAPVARDTIFRIASMANSLR